MSDNVDMDIQSELKEIEQRLFVLLTAAKGKTKDRPKTDEERMYYTVSRGITYMLDSADLALGAFG